MDRQYKKTKYKYNNLIFKKHINATVLSIYNLDKLLVKIDKDIKRVLFIIWDIWSIFIKYKNWTKKVKKNNDQIYTCVLVL